MRLAPVRASCWQPFHHHSPGALCAVLASASFRLPSSIHLPSLPLLQLATSFHLLPFLPRSDIWARPNLICYTNENQ